MYRPITAIEVTAKKAIGMPAELGKYAGTVMISANRITKNTAHVGVRFDPRRRHRLWPGIAPSREKANVIREALVTHAMPQNSCPIVEISSTALAAAVLRAASSTPIAGKPEVSIAFVAPFWTANVSASRTIQPITAE